MAEGSGSTTELRVVSALFADLVGFTSLAETMDAEEVKAILDDYFAKCRKVIERYGGTLEKFIGDAVMAVWGIPRAEEDAAERAVRAGLELVEAIGLPLRVGITTGTVAVGTKDALVAGDVINLAARIQQLATENQVWTDHATRDAAANAIEFEPLGDHAVKGREQRAVLHVARSVIGGRGGLGRVDELDVPLVGYRRELSAIKDALQATIEGERGRLVVVTGEAGIGKSRLGRELLSYADGVEEGIRWHSSRASDLDAGTPYAALEAAVRGRLGVTEQNADELIPRLDAHLREFISDVDKRSQVRAALGVLLGIGTYDIPQHALFVAWTSWFGTLGSDGDAVVWVLDDAHLANELLLSFVEFLVSNVGTRMLVVLLARPDLLALRPGLLTARGSTLIGLDGLSKASMTELVEKLIDAPPDALRDDLVESAGGLPLYAIEVVRGMIDRGEVIVSDGQRRFTGDTRQGEATPSLSAVVMSRLELLEPADRTLLQRASIFGLSFTIRQLAALIEGNEKQVAEAVARLAGKDLLHSATDTLSSEYGQHRFVQALVQQVAYDTLVKGDRARLHLRAADVLSDEHADSGLIVEHLLRARALDETAPSSLDLTEWLFAAAERAEKTSAWGIAMRNYELAIATATDQSTRNTLTLRAGNLAIVQSDFAKARRLAKSITFHEVLDRMHAALILARVNQAQGRLSDAVKILDEWKTLPPGHVPIRLAAFWAAVQGRVAFETPEGSEAATRWAERALAYAEATTDPLLIHVAINQYGSSIGGIGLGRVARIIHEEGARFARAHGLVSQLGWSLNNLALAEAKAGGFDRAIGFLDEAIEIDLAWASGVQLSIPLAAQIEYLTLVGKVSRALEVATLAEEKFGPAQVETISESAEMRQAIAWVRDVAGLPNDPTLFPLVEDAASADPTLLRVITNTLATLAAVDGRPDAARLARDACLMEFEAAALGDALPTMWGRAANFNLDVNDLAGAAAMLDYIPELGDAPDDRVMTIQVRRIMATLDALDPSRHASFELAEHGLRTSLDALASVDLVLDRCRTLVVLAGLLDAHSRGAEASELRAEAASTLTECGAFGLRRQLGLDKV